MSDISKLENRNSQCDRTVWELPIFAYLLLYHWCVHLGWRGHVLVASWRISKYCLNVVPAMGEQILTIRISSNNSSPKALCNDGSCVYSLLTSILIWSSYIKGVYWNPCVFMTQFSRYLQGHSIKVARTFWLIWGPYLPKFTKYDFYFSSLIWHVTCGIIPLWQKKFIDWSIENMSENLRGQTYIRRNNVLRLFYFVWKSLICKVDAKIWTVIHS